MTELRKWLVAGAAVLALILVVGTVSLLLRQEDDGAAALASERDRAAERASSGLRGGHPEEDSHSSPLRGDFPYPQYVSRRQHVAGQTQEPNPARRQERPSPQATVEVGDRTFQPRSYSRHFQTIAVRGSQEVPVSLAFPGEEGTQVVASAIHGGRIDGRPRGRQLEVGADGELGFTFTPDMAPGLYQIVLRRGFDEDVLQFWVPTERPEYDPPALR